MADIVNEQGKEPEVSKEDMEKLESKKNFTQLTAR